MAAKEISFPVQKEYIKKLRVIGDNIIPNNGNDVLNKNDILTKGESDFHYAFENLGSIRSPLDLTQTEKDTGQYESGMYLVEEWDFENMPIGDTQWVSPDGDDSNVGTKDKPVDSIQTAIDRLDESQGLEGTKNVFVKPGSYEESLFINTKNIDVKGDCEGPSLSVIHDSSVEIIGDGTERPLITVTNMSKDSFDDFISEGISFDWDGVYYSYTGSNFEGRDVRFDGGHMGVSIENFGFQRSSDTSLGVQNILAVGSGSEIRDVYFKDLMTYRSYDTASGADMYFYRVRSSNVSSINFNGAAQAPMVFHNCLSIRHSHSDSNAANKANGDVVAYKESDYVWEGDRTFAGSFPFELTLNSNCEVFALIGSEKVITYTDYFKFYFENTDFVYNTTYDIESIDIKCKQYKGISSGNQNLDNLFCKGVSIQGSGTFDCRVIDCTGDADFQSGTGHVIRGGTIQGNLNVASGVDVTLYNVTVEGNLEGSGSITMNGGGYLGDNNNGNLTYNDLKTT